jgi:hypothetical protein
LSDSGRQGLLLLLLPCAAAADVLLLLLLLLRAMPLCVQGDCYLHHL